MKNKVDSKQTRKAQIESFNSAMESEKTQGSALRRLKQIAKQYDHFSLSDVQSAILNNQEIYFQVIQASYTKAQKRKIEQLRRIKENEPLLTRESFSVIQVIEATKTLEEQSNSLKTFNSEAKAKEYIKTHRLSNRSGITLKIEASETEISTSFTPGEMLRRLQHIEGKFWASYPSAETVTLQMLQTVMDMKTTEKDKALNQKSKTKVNKKAA